MDVIILLSVSTNNKKIETAYNIVPSKETGSTLKWIYGVKLNNLLFCLKFKLAILTWHNTHSLGINHFVKGNTMELLLNAGSMAYSRNATIPVKCYKDQKSKHVSCSI